VFGGDHGVTMAHPLSTRIASLITIAVVACTIAVVLHSTANAQSPDPQQKCSTEAKRAFEELRREYDTEVKGLQLKVDVGLNEYRHYYNSKLKRCLLLVNKNSTMVDETSHTSYLIDTDRAPKIFKTKGEPRDGGGASHSRNTTVVHWCEQ
jgi:hypothetical protein